jgi:uncharacterized membrane protein YhfC
MWLNNSAYILAAIIEIGVPIALAIIVWKKFKVSWAIFGLGVLLFLASLIRIPLNNYLGTLLQSGFRGEIFYVLYGIMAGLMAGIFEEGVRCIALGAVIKPRDYYKGIMYGIGHGGGGESMIFVGFTTLANFIVFKFFPNALPANVLQQMAQVAWYLPLVGAMERIFAISIQIAFSVLIMHAFMYRKYYIIALTVIFHAVVDFVAFYLNYKLGFWYAEIGVAVFAITGIVIIMKLKPRNNHINKSKDEIDMLNYIAANYSSGAEIEK